QAETERLAIRRSVRLRAAIAYLEGVAARDFLVLADSAVAVARAFAVASVRRQELGDANVLEPLQAQVAFAEAERERAEAAGRAEASMSAFRTILAFGPEPPLILADTLTIGPDPPAGAVLEERFAATNADLAAAEAAVRVSQAERRAVRAERLPEFEGEMALQSIGGEYEYFGGRVGLGIPIARIFNNGPDRAAEAAVMLVEAQRDRILTQLTVDLRRQSAELEAARTQVRFYGEVLVPQAERAYDIALRLRREGAASYLEVLQAQTALLATRQAAVEARLNAARLQTILHALTASI
ncbi:MAG: TolC family protein, partial [Dehalococcoidia bacterium]